MEGRVVESGVGERQTGGWGMGKARGWVGEGSEEGAGEGRCVCSCEVGRAEELSCGCSGW